MALATMAAADAQAARVEPADGMPGMVQDAAQGAPPGAAEVAQFGAEVTVERVVVNDQGRVIRELPRSRYRLERFAGGRTRTAMLPSTAGPRVGPLADPYAGMVVEFAPDGSGLRLLDARGQPLAGAPALPAALAPSELGQGGEGFVSSAQDTVRRRGELTRHLGARAGSVRHLERYLDTRGARVQEVLVEPTTALPIEVNVVQDGRLDEHHEFSYQEPIPGHLVRTRTRSESRVPGTTDQRLVTITSLTNVRVSGGVE